MVVCQIKDGNQFYGKKIIERKDYRYSADSF
jgi:hypothetical protein